MNLEQYTYQKIIKEQFELEQEKAGDKVDEAMFWNEVLNEDVDHYDGSR